MSELKNLTIEIKTATEDKLASLNAVLARLDDRHIHQMWCSGMLPFRGDLKEFATGDEPVVCWTVRDKARNLAANLELHHNSYGWVIARVWISPEWRRKALARKLFILAMDKVFKNAERISCFCDVRNLPSKKLQLSMGFQVKAFWPETQLEFLTLDRAGYERLKRSGRGKVSTAFSSLPPRPIATSATHHRA